VKAIKSKIGAAIFHIHGGWVPAFYKIAKILSKNKIPYIFTPHGAYNVIAMERSALTKKIYFNLFETTVLKHANKIHCIGNSEIVGLKTIFNTEKMVLLPYGFEMPEVKIETRRQHNEMIVGFVGRLDIHTKGLDLLLNAFKNFHAHVNDSKLWIIGGGTDSKIFQEMVNEKELQSSVVLYGSKFGDEKDSLIKQMTVFAHPSRNEGLPASVLEACNFGIPSIVSKATNMADYIDSFYAGISVEDENEADIERALFQIHKLWKSNQLDDLKTNAQLMVKNSFNWDQVILKFESLYTIN
jgi:glycosyltransferase involved in cell wall biosynthesis